MATTSSSSVQSVAAGTKITSIGTVKTVIGTVTATDANGVTRTLQVGDKVFTNDIIQTAAAGAILIEFTNGSHMDLGRDSKIVLDLDVFNPAAAVAEQSDIAAIQAQIAAGADPTQITEATAAGAGGGEEGGASFIVVDQAAPQGLVTSGFPTGPISVAFDQPEAELPVIEPEAGPTPPTVTVIVTLPPEEQPYPGGSEDPNDPTLPHIIGNNAYIPEGTDGPDLFNTVTFILQLSNPYPEDIVVHYTIYPGTAGAVDGAIDTVNDDYTGVLSGTVTIPANTTEVPVTINLIPDHFDEGANTLAGAENFYIVLDEVVTNNATIDPAANTATAWIVDDDTTPVAASDTNWTMEDVSEATVEGNVILGMPHPGDPSETLEFSDIADTDADGDQLFVTSVNGNAANVGQPVTGAYGTLILNSTGTYEYVVDPTKTQFLDEGEIRTDEFTYVVTDTYNAPQTATLTITIFGSNDAPVANADTNWVLEDTTPSASGNVLNDVAHPGDPSPALAFADVADTDVDVEALSVTTVGTFNGNYGTLTIGSDGAYTYTLYASEVEATAAGHAGGYNAVQAHDTNDDPLTDSFNYTASDGSTTANSTLTISVFGLNDAPVANADTNWVLEDTTPSASGNVLNDVAHPGDPSPALAFADVADTDVDVEALSVTTVGTFNGNYGTLTIGSDGAYTYTLYASEVEAAAAGHAGGYNAVQAHDTNDDPLTDSFNYTASDGSTTANSTLTISIFGANDKPVVVINSDGIGDEVFESGMLQGTASVTNGEFASGSFSFSDTDGLDDIQSIQLGTNVFTLTGGGGTFASFAAMVGESFDTTNGTVTLTGYNNGTFDYTFELTSRTADVADQVESNSFDVAVSDGTVWSDPATVTITIVDDEPFNFVPQAGAMTNAADTILTGRLDLDHNIDNNTGADQLGSVTFADITSGQPMTGVKSGSTQVYLYLSDDGQTVVGSTLSGSTYATASTTTANKVFVLELNQDGSFDTANDSYTMTLLKPIDNGSGVTFSNLTGTGPAGNPPWKVVESPAGPNVGKDILFTPMGSATTVNSDSDDVAVGSQFIGFNDGLRIDFADMEIITNAQGKVTGYSFGDPDDQHYTVNNFTFTVDQISNGTDANMTIKVWNANGDQDFSNDSLVQVNRVDVYRGGVLIASASADATVAGIGFNFLDGGGTAGDDYVTITGLLAGDKVVTSSLTGYDRIEIVNAGTGGDDGKFSLSHLELETVNSGSPVDMNFNLELTDADGDVSTGTLNLTLEPSALAGANILSGTANADTLYGGGNDDSISGLASADTLTGGSGNDILNGGDGNDILVGGIGNDTMTGGAGKDEFVFNSDSFSNAGNDTITDFHLGNNNPADLIADDPNADVLDISDVLIAAHAADAGIPTDLASAINGGFLKVETVDGDANAARIVLDLDGTGSGTNTVAIVTLDNLSTPIDTAGLLTQLLQDGQLK